jgi:hypothetical protein
MIRKIGWLLALLIIVSCSSEHPDIKGHTKVRLNFAGQPFVSTDEDSYTRVDENDLRKDIFIYAVDSVINATIDFKITIDKTGLGTYSFQGDLYNSDAYIFVNQNSFLEHYAPHTNGRSAGSIIITRNNGNRITGTFEVLTFDSETGLEQLRLENGTFDFRY